MIASVICEMLGIKYPIFQGGMAWIADSGLAAAVSEAGGLGIISASEPKGLKAEIDRLRSLTAKPFGVNLMLMNPDADELARLLIDEKVPIVTTGAGNPGKYAKAWIEAGIKLIPVVPSVSMAKLAKRHGACAVIAEGGEAGGHVGDTTTMALVPQIADAVDLPVIAAGGIADGRGVAAALMLGADGVQLGTRFLVAEECAIHPVYKEKVLRAKDLDTIVTGKRLGHPVRSIKTPFSRGYAKLEYTAETDEEVGALGIGAFRKAVQQGDEKEGSFLCGQIAGLVKKKQSAAEIIEEIFTEAEALLKGASKWVK